MRTLLSWLSLGTLALAGVPAPVSAQPVGSEFQVNTYTTSHQSPNPGHSIAADASGNFVVVWSSLGQDGGDGVFGQRYDSEGQPLGAEFRVNSFTSESGGAAVAAAADGDFVVVWSSARDAGYGGIFGQRYDSNGAPVGDSFRVNSYTTNRQTYAAVSSDADGNFVVVWTSENQDGSFYGIFGQRYDSDGVPLAGEFRVNTFTTSTQWLPSVASDSRGNFVVVWESFYQGDAYGDIFGQRYDNEGQPLGAEFRVNTTTKQDEQFPAVASDPVGNFVVVWSSGAPSGRSNGIFGQRYDSAGVPLGGEFRVNMSPERGQHGVSSDVAYDASGEFVVTWHGHPDGSSFGVFGRRYDTAGVPKGGDFQINVYTTGSQALASVAATGPGQFVAAWLSRDQDGSGYGVFGRRFGREPHHQRRVAGSSAASDPQDED